MKLLLKLGSFVLGKALVGDQPRADMYLPIWLFGFSVILNLGGAAALVYAVLRLSVIAAVIAVICLGIGVLALLCWKNQTINILTSNSFEYCTFLGKKTVYRFSDIKELRYNSDSMTLFVGDGKVHIESCAILSDRLVEAINSQLEANRGVDA